MTLKAIKDVIFNNKPSMEKVGPNYSHIPLDEHMRDRLLDELFDAQRDLLSSKGHDYAGEDLLSNFRLAGMIVNQTSAHPDAINCLNLIGTKVARLGQLLNSGKTAQNESVYDSVIDLANYTALLYLILKVNK